MILAFDIGGSFIESAISPEPGELADIRRTETPGDSFEAFLEIVEQRYGSLSIRPEAVSISITGVVNPRTGALVCANVACLHGRRLGFELASRLGLKALIANDADCFALAEAVGGAGRAHDTVFGIILGSGVGGGVVVRGNLINRAGFAGEWGHGPILAGIARREDLEIPAFPCSCGQKGCVNTVGGARGLERLHVFLHAETSDSGQIVSAFEQGEAKATSTVDLMTSLLSAPLALAVNITGATVVPAGGGLANSAMLLSKLDEKTRAASLAEFQAPLVVKAECGIDAGLIGAAALGWSKVRNG